MNTVFFRYFCRFFWSIYALWTLNIPWQCVPQFNYVWGENTSVLFLLNLHWIWLFILKCHSCLLINHISPTHDSRNLIVIVSLLLSPLQSEESCNRASLYLCFILNLVRDTSISLSCFGSDNYNDVALKMRSQCLHIVWHNMFLFLFSIPFLLVFTILFCVFDFCWALRWHFEMVVDGMLQSLLPS